MRSVVLTAAVLALVSAASAPPAAAQVMARGFYNHVGARISFYLPEITSVDQVQIEQIEYSVEGFDPKIVPATRFNYQSPRGSRYAVTSVDFAPYYEQHDSTVQASMAAAATQYRRMGEVTHDSSTRSDRIPAHILHVRLPNDRILYVWFLLHQDDVLDQRRLVIAEAETAPNARQPGLFLASLGIINPEFFGRTDVDHTFWRVRYTPAGPPTLGAELVATQPWGVGEFEEIMSAGGEAVPGE